MDFKISPPDLGITEDPPTFKPSLYPHTFLLDRKDSLQEYISPVESGPSWLYPTLGGLHENSDHCIRPSVDSNLSQFDSFYRLDCKIPDWVYTIPIPFELELEEHLALKEGTVHGSQPRIPEPDAKPTPSRHRGLAKMHLRSEQSLKDQHVRGNRARPTTRSNQPTRKGLPINFHMSGSSVNLMTGYDTGTIANHITIAQAELLGLEISKDSLEDVAQFRLANGKVIDSVGRTSAYISFAQGRGKQEKILCYFNVFDKLAVPVLLGLSFLNATQTLSKFCDRLVDLPGRVLRSLRVCAVGDTSNEVACVINGREIFASADTGSEIALMSGDYARSLGMMESEFVQEIEFADGSIGYTSGVADVNLSLASKAGFRQKRSIRARFHVLEELSVDVLLDETLVTQLSAFSSRACQLFIRAQKLVEDLCPIRHLRTIEKSIMGIGAQVSFFSKKVGQRFGVAAGSDAQDVTQLPEQEEKLLLQQLNALDQQENSIRAAGVPVVTASAEDSQPLSIHAEDQRRSEYLEKRKKLLRRLESLKTSHIPAAGGGSSSSSTSSS